MPRPKIKHFLFVFLCLFALSCFQRDTTSHSAPKSNASFAYSIKAGDFAPGQLEAHYLKHRYQFGNLTQEQYLTNARNLLNAPLTNDVLLKSRSNGDILRYRVSSGEFAVMASDGTIRTYFKADYRYWSKQ